LTRGLWAFVSAWEVSKGWLRVVGRVEARDPTTAHRVSAILSDLASLYPTYDAGARIDGHKPKLRLRGHDDAGSVIDAARAFVRPWAVL